MMGLGFASRGAHIPAGLDFYFELSNLSSGYDHVFEIELSDLDSTQIVPAFLRMK